MNDRKMSRQRAETLAAFIATLRTDWQQPGILRALEKAAQRPDQADAYQTAIAAIRYAGDPSIRNPGAFHLDGNHWRPAATDEDAPKATPTPTTIADMRCPHCGLWRVRGEDHVCGQILDPDQTHAAAAAARAAMKNAPEESQ